MTDQSFFRMAPIVGPPGPLVDGAPVRQMNRYAREGEAVVTGNGGNFLEACSRNAVFFAAVAAVTLPVVANNLVSVFSLYNPTNSGILMELIDADFSSVLATDVVDSVGLYYQANAGGTFTTQGIPVNRLLGSPISPKGQFYSAYTHVGTPTLAAIIGGWGATSDTANNTVSKKFDGSLILYPGTVASFAMTTAASSISGITGGCSWRERAI